MSLNLSVALLASTLYFKVWVEVLPVPVTVSASGVPRSFLTVSYMLPFLTLSYLVWVRVAPFENPVKLLETALSFTNLIWIVAPLSDESGLLQAKVVVFEALDEFLALDDDEEVEDEVDEEVDEVDADELVVLTSAASEPNNSLALAVVVPPLPFFSSPVVILSNLTKLVSLLVEDDEEDDDDVFSVLTELELLLLALSELLEPQAVKVKVANKAVAIVIVFFIIKIPQCMYSFYRHQDLVCSYYFQNQF